MNCWTERSSTPFTKRISSSRPGVGTPTPSGRMRRWATGHWLWRCSYPPSARPPARPLSTPRDPQGCFSTDIHPGPPTEPVTTTPFRRDRLKSADHAVMETWLHAIALAVVCRDGFMFDCDHESMIACNVLGLDGCLYPGLACGLPQGSRIGSAVLCLGWVRRRPGSLMP